MKFALTLFACFLVPAFALAQPSEWKSAIELPPIDESAMYADAIFLGKVVEVEKQTVDARLNYGSPKSDLVTFDVAVIKVTEAIFGAGGVTQYRVGFAEPVEQQAGGDLADGVDEHLQDREGRQDARGDLEPFGGLDAGDAEGRPVQHRRDVGENAHRPDGPGEPCGTGGRRRKGGGRFWGVWHGPTL